MGWASGSRLFGEIIEQVKEEFEDDHTRSKIYDILIMSFEDYDCDTLDECLEIDDVFDKMYYVIHPREE